MEDKKILPCKKGCMPQYYKRRAFFMKEDRHSLICPHDSQLSSTYEGVVKAWNAAQKEDLKEKE